MRLRQFAFVALLLLTAACGHSLHYTALNRPPRELTPRSPETVELFLSKGPDRAFVEVGLFEIEQRTPGSGGTDAMIAKVRARAAQVGCDAVRISEPTERVQSVSGQSFGTVHQGGASSYGTYQGTTTASVNVVRGHRAVCLVYTDPPAVTGAEVAL